MAERPPRRLLSPARLRSTSTFAREKAFVACGDDGTVHRHRLDGGFVREARVPVGSYNVTFGRGRVVSPSLWEGALSARPGRASRGGARVARAAHDACIVIGP